jgi:exosortase
LINHLRVEWSVNPQYAYGWAVPFLCLYLLWRKAESRKQKAEIGVGDGEVTGPRDPGPQAVGHIWSRGPVLLWCLALLSFLYLPTRLIQEANPEWRLVSWALALEVIGLTLLTIRLVSTVHNPQSTVQSPQSTLRDPRFGRLATWISAFQRLSLRDFAFPICFFLVAVPWPTVVEGPLVQGLMRANVGVTAELLSAFGVPAVPHGNIIEVATGPVGVDDACSGIRSFQASLMISLFLGELYGLKAGRRVLCIVAGFALSFLFNVARTTLLTWVAACKGTAAIASWHDPAGVTVLVGCFLSLWGVAVGLKRRISLESRVLGLESEVHSPQSRFGGVEVEKVEAIHASGLFSVSAFRRFSIVLIAWLVFAEAATELWYRSHEWGIAKAATWHVELPREDASFRELPFSDKTKQFLRYDEGCNGTWQEGADQRWQAIFLRWNPGRIAVHLAKSHTPEVCLTAAGRELVSQSGLRAFPVHGLQLPFRSYVVMDQSGPLHVFYCLWEDRANAQSFRTTMMTYGNRLAPVLAGRRNSGQRSLEIAISGIPDQQEADAALASKLQKLVTVDE